MFAARASYKRCLREAVATNRRIAEQRQARRTRRCRSLITTHVMWAGCSAMQQRPPFHPSLVHATPRCGALAATFALFVYSNTGRAKTKYSSTCIDPATQSRTNLLYIAPWYQLLTATASVSRVTFVLYTQMHMVLRVVYGNEQQLRYLFNRTTLRHLSGMVRVCAYMGHVES